MIDLAGLGFTTPWILGALAALPALWYLLRVSPPAPRRVPFPPLRILRELTQREETPARTPPWLLALRLLIATLVILALSGPVLNPESRLAGRGPVILVVDDGWAAAPDWDTRRQTLETLIDRAERANRPVALIGTAPNAGTTELILLDTAAEARRRVRLLEPRPWSTDRAALAKRIADASTLREGDVFWICDGLEDGGMKALGEALRPIGPVRVIAPDPSRTALGLTLPGMDTHVLRAQLVRATRGLPASAEVLAVSRKGLVLGRATAQFGPQDLSAPATFDLPVEVRNAVVRLSLARDPSAGGVGLLDESWARRVIGIISSSDIEQQQPLLSQAFYLQRALSPFAEIAHGDLQTLLDRKLSVMILADVGRLPDADAARIASWVADGGVLVRFAGPRLAQAQDQAEAPDTLLPVNLRRGGRALGGALSWEKPAPLAPFETGSPFLGLTAPKDVVVKRQILAEPGPDLAARTWARLADGTPLVTADHRNHGWVVLFHVTASPDWSNLPISGLFVDMLRRIAALSQGVAAPGLQETRPLMPQATLDGFGRLGAPPAQALPIPASTFVATQAGPLHPPGFYGVAGTTGGQRALNLLPPDATLEPLSDLPAGLERVGFVPAREVDLGRWLLAAAIALGLLDGIAVLALRGHLGWPESLRRRGRAAAALALFSLSALAGTTLPNRAAAQNAAQQSEPTNPEEKLRAAVLDTRLAYVITGDGEVDAMSRAGLVGLSQVLTERTAFEPAPPFGVDPETDDLAAYPVLYWPMSAAQRPLSDAAITKVGAYLRNGGLILFDTRDQRSGFGDTIAPGEGTKLLRRILSRLDVPPLVPVPESHVLTKSFYLLQTFPGRYNGGRVWVEAPPSQDSLFNTDGADRDGVSSLVVGGNDWAAAWAVNEAGQPLAAIAPGDLRQREMAYRFGVNLVMYALTGNYKADQVHVPALLQRLGQ